MAMALVLTTLCGGSVVYADGDNANYVKGDITGDGYIGTEDAFYSALFSSKYLVTEEAVLPPMVKYQKEELDVDGDSVSTWSDTVEILKAIAGNVDWGKGNHKITSSEKVDVTYECNGQYVTAIMNIPKMMDTAVIYDNTKVKYIGKSVESEETFQVIYDNAEQGYVEVVAVSPFEFDSVQTESYGTIELKFEIKEGSEDIAFSSCTGAGYIQDNMEEGESFAEAAQKYAEAMYTEDTVKTFSVSLSDVQQILKVALKITNVKEAGNVPADINGDGQVTLEDAQLALQVALKIISLDELD